ncbi:MAG: hypothetical protein ACTSWZ_00760 [Candidatus Heimdallarchaeaceae archaeon]
MLIEVQPLVDIIALSLQSAFVKNEKNGISLLLIAKPETAKTSSIFQFSNLNFVSYYDEITQKKLIDEFLPLVKNKEKRTLLIPDLINCIEKQRSTREQFLNMVKSAIDDTGILAISTYHKQLHFYKLLEGLRFNLITAITVNNFKLIYKKLRNTGLLSRFLPFSYDYPLNKVHKIFRLIEEFDMRKIWIEEQKVIIPKIYQKEKEVKVYPEHLKEFEIFAVKLGEQYQGFGIRALTNFRRLLKANALLNKRTETTEEDVMKVMKLTKWINFEFNPL